MCTVLTVNIYRQSKHSNLFRSLLAHKCLHALLAAMREINYIRNRLHFGHRRVVCDIEFYALCPMCVEKSTIFLVSDYVFDRFLLNILTTACFLGNTDNLSLRICHLMYSYWINNNLNALIIINMESMCNATHTCLKYSLQFTGLKSYTEQFIQNKICKCRSFTLYTLFWINCLV